jgi:hypothetical protein
MRSDNGTFRIATYPTTYITIHKLIPFFFKTISWSPWSKKKIRILGFRVEEKGDDM